MAFKNKPSLSKRINFSACLCIIFLLSACGNDHPKLIQFKAFDDKFNTVIDTKDPEKLETISALFHDRKLVEGVAADFKYLMDFTTAEGTERWRCSPNGYCFLRKKELTTALQKEIYKIERYRELYRESKLN